MAYIGMAYIVMAYIGMTYIVNSKKERDELLGAYGALRRPAEETVVEVLEKIVARRSLNRTGVREDAAQCTWAPRSGGCPAQCTRRATEEQESAPSSRPMQNKGRNLRQLLQLNRKMTNRRNSANFGNFVTSVILVTLVTRHKCTLDVAESQGSILVSIEERESFLRMFQ